MHRRAWVAVSALLALSCTREKPAPSHETPSATAAASEPVVTAPSAGVPAVAAPAVDAAAARRPMPQFAGDYDCGEGMHVSFQQHGWIVSGSGTSSDRRYAITYRCAIDRNDGKCAGARHMFLKRDGSASEVETFPMTWRVEDGGVSYESQATVTHCARQ